MSDIQRLCDLTLKPQTHCIPPSVVYCQFGDITLDKQNKHEKKKTTDPNGKVRVSCSTN